MNLLRTGWRATAIRILAARAGRAALTASGVGLGILMLTTMIVLNTTMQTALIARMRAEQGTYDVMILARDFEQGYISAESLRRIEAMDELAFGVPFLTRYSGSPDTPIHFDTAAGEFPADEMGMRLLQGRLPGPGEVVLPERLAERMGLDLGDGLTLPFAEASLSVTLVGLADDASSAAFFEYGWLAERLGVSGPSGLLVGLKPGVSKQRFAGLVQLDNPDVVLDLRKWLDEARWKLNGFGTIGTFLGMAALITGAYLSMGAFGVTVRERGRELAMLRLVGAGRGQIVRLLAQEVLILGVVGSAAGIALGVAVSHATLGVAGNYLGLPTERLVLPWIALVVTGGVGVALALLGAWPAVVLGSRTPPLAAIRPQSDTQEGRNRRNGLLLGLVLLLLGSAAGGAGFMRWIPAMATFLITTAGAFLLLLGVTIGLPQWLQWLVRGCAGILGRLWPVQVSLAERNLRRHLDRSARTGGVMVLGIAMLVALAGLIGTEILQQEYSWQQRNPADGIISGPWGSPIGFSDNLVQRVAAIHGVAEVVPLGRELKVDLVGYDQARAIAGYGTKYAGDSPGRFYLQALWFPRLAEAWDLGAVEGDLQTGLVITREHAADLGLTLGESLRLQPEGEEGEQRLRVSALVDRLPMRGSLAVSPEAAPWALRPGAEYRVAWVWYLPDADPDAIQAAVGQVLDGGHAAFTYMDREQMRASSTRRMWESLALVGLVGVVVLLIASAGLLTTMMANLRGRLGEFAAVRAVGASAGQLRLMIGLEALLLGLAGSLLGCLTGLAMLMAIVSGGLSDGWPVYFPFWVVLVTLLAGPLLALLAALPPMHWVSGLPLTAALRTD